MSNMNASCRLLVQNSICNAVLEDARDACVVAAGQQVGGGWQAERKVAADDDSCKVPFGGAKAAKVQARYLGSAQSLVAASGNGSSRVGLMGQIWRASTGLFCAIIRSRPL